MRIAIFDLLREQGQIWTNSQLWGHYTTCRSSEGPKSLSGELLGSISTGQESHPDTGESGETYDVEQLSYDKARISLTST